MDPISLQMIAPMVVAIVLILTVGGVVLLRPLSKRLGWLLEAMARDRERPQIGQEMERLRELLETMNGRLTLLEERQDFTDALLTDPERRRLRAPTESEGDVPERSAAVKEG